MKKKFSSIILVLSMLCAFMPVIATAETSGTCGDNLTWTLDDNGTLTISGTGDMTNYTSLSFVPWYRNRLNIESVVIENSVTSIGDSAFRNCSGLTNVTIGNSVTSIGYAAFYDCSGLTSVIIPNSVTSIGKLAFYNCSNLETVYFNAQNCTTMGSYSYPVFENCTSLKEIYIGDDVETIPSYAFNDCTIEILNYNAENYIPAFENSLKEIHLGSNVKTIPANAFSNTVYYEDDTNWENGILYIDNCLVAAKSNITDVNIKSECRLIADSVFINCSSLDSVHISDLAAYLNINFGNDKSSPMYYVNKLYLNDKRITSLDIPDGVTKIPFYAFAGCDSLKEITLPNSITDIQNGALKDCTSLTDITIPDNVTNIGDFAFSGCLGLTNLDIPNSVKTLGESAFSGCSSLTSIKIPNGVTSIGQKAFANCSNLTDITIPNSVTNIAESTFANCSKLTSITMPANVTNIGYAAFENCRNLENITIPESVTSIGSYAFGGCSSLTDVYIPSLDWWLDNYSNFSSSPMSYANNIYINGELVRNVIIPDDYTEIKSGTFSGWGCLESVTIPKTVTNIGKNAFSSCENLTTVNYNAPKVFSNIFNSNSYYSKNNLLLMVLGSDVESIDENAFASCNQLTRILISKSVTEIEKGAFSDCSKLTTVEYGGSQSDWNEMYIGVDNENLTNATIVYNSSLTNTSLTDLDYLTYTKNDDNTITITDCNTAATNINIPDKIDGLKVTAIDSQAFYNCSKLTTITIPNSITSIGGSAFYNCDNLKDIYFTGTEKQWKTIDISWSNDNLTNATIHYNGVAPTPKPTPTPTPKPTPKPTPIPTTTATVTKSETETTYNFDVTPEATYENSYVYAAIYDDNGILLAVNRVPLEMTGNTSISVNKSANDALAKIFIWADTLQPIIEKAEEFPLTN